MAASAEFPPIPESWTEQFERIDKDRLFVRLLFKKNLKDLGHPPRLLLIVHGLGEQSDRYEHFPFYLHSSIDAIGLFDLPGHGKSSGIRGHVQSYDQYSSACLTALQYFMDQLHRQTGRTPEVHWFGHSMGGLITLRTLLKKVDLGLASVTASSPLLGLAFEPPALKKYSALIIEPFLGWMALKNDLDPNDISHDPGVRRLYTENPLNHDRVTPRWVARTLREMELLKTPSAEFSYPLMMICPLSDRIVSWKAGFRFFERLRMKPPFKKELHSFPEFYHESFNELGKERAFVALETWIQKNTRCL